MSIFDGLCCGVSLFILNLHRVVFEKYTPDEANEPIYVFNGTLAQIVRQEILDPMKGSFNYYCFMLYLVLVVNDYATWPSLLYMAIERFCVICHSQKYYTWFSHKRKKIYAAILTLVVALPIILSFTFTVVIRQLDGQCDHSFYGLAYLRYVIDGFFCFLLPLAICCVLYFKVWRQLRLNEVESDRNRTLTVAFGLICFLWLVFWLPRYVTQYYRLP